MDEEVFSSMSILLLLGIFAVAAGLVWISGTKLSGVADKLAEKTGLGRAFIGVLLLGGITSLPEAVTTIATSLKGNAGMAVSNILGGVSMQVTILAVVDFFKRKYPLSSRSTSLNVLLQGIALILMLALTVIFIPVPDLSIGHFGLQSVVLLLLFTGSLYLTHKYTGIVWLSYQTDNTKTLKERISFLQDKLRQVEEKDTQGTEAEMTTAGFMKQHWWTFLWSSGLILIGGYFVIVSAEAIAEQSGISKNFAGLVLVAITTSLPEVSTVVGAVKLKRYEMAFSNIFGTNLFDVALIFLADLFFLEGPVFNALDQFSIVAAALGIVLTVIFLLGLTMKSERKLLGVGYDSLTVIALYLAGLVVLFRLDQS